jgi:uncharacterized membrane protein
MTEEKKAQRVYTLEEIKYNEGNKAKAILACIPLIGFVLLLVEKDDQFVRYMGAQYTVVGVIQIVLSIIVILAPFVGLGSFLLIVVGITKVLKGERFDIPYVSDWALKLMSSL